MTYPAWPYPESQSSLDVQASVPRAEFQPDFGPPIGRPRTTAIDETAQLTVFLPRGQYREFRQWWSDTARGGPFEWKRADTNEVVVMHPVGGGYRAETLLGRVSGDELVRVNLAVHVGEVLRLDEWFLAGGFINPLGQWFDDEVL